MTDHEIDIEDGRDGDDDLGDSCDYCGSEPVVADIGGQDVCADCLEEHQ